VIVTAASVHDTADGIRLLDEFTIARPGVCKVWADGARLSILCIFDMSRKTSPIDVSENHLFTLQPTLRGPTNPQAPSLVAAIVVNGICRSPVPGRAAGHPRCPAVLALDQPGTRGIRRRRVPSSRALARFPCAVHEPFFRAG
jgi:hypothetical protein